MASSASPADTQMSGARQVRTVIACRKRFMLSINPDRRREAPVAFVTRASPDAIAIYRPDHAARAAVCKSPHHQHTALPAPLLVGTARSKPLARRSCCRHRSEMATTARSTSISLAPCCSSRPSEHLRLPFSRQTRVLEVVDGLQRLTTLTILFCVLRDLDAKDAGKPNERLLAAIGTGQGGNARPRLSLREADEAFFQAHVRNAGATSIAPVSDSPSPHGSADRRGSRSLARGAAGLRPCPAPPPRRLPARQVPCGGGVDDRHRSRTPHIHGPECQRQAARTQRHPEGRPARRRAARSDEARNAHLGSWRSRASATNSRTSSAISAPSTHATRPRSSPASEDIAAEAGGGRPFIERILQPAAAVFDDILKSRHEGSPHSPTISSLADLSRLAEGAQRLGAAGDAVVARKGQGCRGTRVVPRRARSPGLRPAHPGSRRQAPRQPLRRRGARHPQQPGSEKRGEPAQSRARRAAHHPSQSARPARPQRADGQAGAAPPQRPPGRQRTGRAVRGSLHRAPAAAQAGHQWSMAGTPFPIPPSATATPSCSATSCWSPRRRTTRPATWTSPARRRCCSRPPERRRCPSTPTCGSRTEWTSQQIREREAELMRHLDQLWRIGPQPSRPDPASAASKRARQPQTAGA